MPRQHIIKAVSPSPEPEDEEKVPSSPPTMPSTDTANDSDPTTSVDGRSDTPALSKTTSNSASKYTPSTYLPPSNTTELPDTATATTPLIETEDTREAEEEHETPLLPLNSEVVNASTPRSTGAFILLWAVGIILAPLAVAMCYAAYCICLEFDLQRWLDIMPSMESLPFIGRYVLFTLYSTQA